MSLPRSLLLLLTFTFTFRISEALKGDSWCGTLMCVDATVDGPTVTYQLRSLNQLGWMSIGFGTQMPDTPLVIMWPNANGSVTLSQRQASGRVQPTPVVNPPRRATIHGNTDLTPNVSPGLAFDIAKNNDTVQQLIWAFGVTPPAPDPSTDIEQHLDAGSFSLDITKDLPDDSNPPAQSSPSGTTPGAAPTSASPSPDLTASASASPGALVAAHAALSALGFLVFLPAAALLARWTRTWNAQWLPAHRVIGVMIGVPVITIGWALGFLAVAQQGGPHLRGAHQIVGVVLFALYLVQVALGVYVQSRLPRSGAIHPPRNVVHVVLGLGTLALAAYETRTGLSSDSFLDEGSRDAVTTVWLVWTVLFPCAYGAGLVLLRRQFAQERLGWDMSVSVSQTVRLSAQETSLTAETGRRRMLDRWADDGTHDMYSSPRPRSRDLLLGENAGGTPSTSVTEMREVQRMVPISVLS